MRPEELLEEAAALLEKRGPAPVVDASRLLVVGDTHGFPEVSRWALGLAEEEGVEHVIFLGDYVDRGPGGVENLELLAERLLSEPERLTLLRGNHEDYEMNLSYGFAREARRKRGPSYIRVLEERFYPCLPLAARAGGVVFVHGGVPCRRCRDEPEEPIGLWEGWAAEELASLHCRLRSTYTGSSLARHLMWNDPRPGLEWFEPSPRGPGVYLYGWRAWRGFLEANQAEVLVRGHEVADAARIDSRTGSVEGPPSGWEVSLDRLRGRVVTVFSSLYHGMGAGALLLDLRERVARLYRYPRSL